MKKFLAVLLMFVAAGAYAFDIEEIDEVKFKVVPGYSSLQKPDFTYDEGTKGGVGVIGQALTKFDESIDVGVEVGYLSLYSYKREDVVGGTTYNLEMSLYTIPVYVVGRYYIGKRGSDLLPFVTAGAGYNYVTLKTQSNLIGDSTDTYNYFGGSIGIGAEIKAGADFTIEPQVRYNVILESGENTESTFIGVGIGFK